MPADPPSDTHVAAQHWRIAAGAALRIRDWDGDFLVFNPLSGHTHVLDDVAGSLLNELLCGNRSEAALQHWIAELLDLPLDAQLQQQLRTLLSGLDTQGLIEPTARC